MLSPHHGPHRTPRRAPFAKVSPLFRAGIAWLDRLAAALGPRAERTPVPIRVRRDPHNFPPRTPRG